jgi:hypothetical protein
MKINLTKKEYRALIDMLQIAQWIILSYRVESSPETEKYRSLEQKLLSFAEEMGLKRLIQYDEQSGTYFPSKPFQDESPAGGYIEEYSEQNFWDELMDRLALRDLIMREGEEEVGRMDLEERSEKLDDLRDKYYSEFKEHGISRLIIHPQLYSH